MSNDAVISVEGVSKRFRLYHERNQSLKSAFMRRGRARYDEFWALQDVSFEVTSGMTFGLVGHNGSGKSTMLKCIARILRPEKGRISVEGRMSALLELGAGFHPELSGRENVYLNGSILGMSKRQLERKFDEIVEFAGLERFIDMPVKNYSSGMYVRLGFSIAINVDPDILLVDEVLAVGDEEFQRKCLERVADLREAGKTIVVVTHALGTVRNLCDEAIWLEHGVMRERGKGGDIADAYLGQVHVDREADESGHGTRWGSGDIRITDVDMLGPNGQPTEQIQTGDEVTFRLRYEATRSVERPVFGLGVFTLEGVQVSGPNTREAGVWVDSVDGAGVVELHVDRLLLLPGSYVVSAASTDETISHTFDHRHKAFHFDVKPGTPHETYGGVISFDGRWGYGR
ncbi:MAG TPA: ABC transporter ATP-binding protein [Acidimicrobiales bacterium]|nr:ABC transporter ATP-binding protein [Acidimicrobiales bacterium]